MRTGNAHRLITGETGRRVHAARIADDMSLCNAVPNRGEVEIDLFQLGIEQVTCAHCKRILWLRRFNGLDDQGKATG